MKVMSASLDPSFFIAHLEIPRERPRELLYCSFLVNPSSTSWGESLALVLLRRLYLPSKWYHGYDEGGESCRVGIRRERV